MKSSVFFVLSVVTIFILSACASPGDKTAIGTGTGAVLGAGLGAIIGSATGNAGRGVAIGGGTGAVIGAALGNVFDGVDEEHEAQRAVISQQQAQIDENRRLLEELRGRGADVVSTQRGLVINLPDILFEFDRHHLTPDARRTVAEISDVLVTIKDRPIYVEGHTDSIGDAAYNYRLSVNRAQSVATELKRRGVTGSSLRVEGYGEGRPIATNNTDAGRARNRRVEIIVENN